MVKSNPKYHLLAPNDERRPSVYLLKYLTTGSVFPFRDQVAQDAFDFIVDHGICAGRGIDLPVEYDPYCRDLIKSFGWDNIMEVPDVYYDGLVKLFYANLRRECTGGEPCLLSTRVKGKDILLSIEELGHCLGIPTDGDRIFFTKQDQIQQHIQISMQEYYGSFCVTTTPVGQLRATDIQPRFRLLKHFISFTILPRVGHSAEIEPFFGFLIHCFAVGRKLCLPYVIQEYMWHSLEQVKIGKALPYGAFISRILSHFQVEIEAHDVGLPPERNIDISGVRKLEGFLSAAEVGIPVTTRSKRRLVRSAPGESSRRASTSDVPRPEIPVDQSGSAPATKDDISMLKKWMRASFKKMEKSIFKKVIKYVNREVSSSGGPSGSYPSHASASSSSRGV